MKYTFDPITLEPVAKIMASLNPVEIVKPKNVADAKALWLLDAKSGKYANPRFAYDEEKLKTISGYNSLLTSARAQFENGLTPEDETDKIIKKILLHRFDDAIRTTEIAASILLRDDQATCALANRIYGHPSNSQVIKAYGIINEEETLSAGVPRFSESDREALKKIQCNAKAIAYWFTEVIQRYCFTGWTVEVSDRFTAIDVQDKNSSGESVIGIPTDRKVNGLKLLELIGHELECHLRGSENCRALIRQVLEIESANPPLAPFIPILAKSDNELFYEGVAKISDVGVLGEAGLPTPYATIACYRAGHNSSFSETAKDIEDCRRKMGEDEETARKGAWTTTYRIMRGCTNTAVGGYAFSKDYIYMAGYDFANQINPNLHNFASMTVDELAALQVALLNLYPAYQNLDAVGWIKERLLSGEKAE